MVKFHRTLAFRHTVQFVCFFVVLEALVFAGLYKRTLAVYEARTNAQIEEEAAEITQRAANLTVTQLATLLKERFEADPGQFEVYMLAGQRYEYVDGNVHEWPRGLTEPAKSTDLTLGRAGSKPHHRVLSVSLKNGCHLLIGRDLSEFYEIRRLIGRALIWTAGLTLGLGLCGGYLFSRVVARRLDKINRGSRAILHGDISRRMPVTGSGDEFDALALNLNRMLDRIEQLMNGLREVTDNIAHDLRKPISRVRTRIELTLMGTFDPEAYRDTMAGALEDIDRILNVFNALLTIASAESGFSRDRFVPVDLVRLAASTAEIYEPVAEEAGLEIKVETPQAVTIQGDPDLIAQAVANLVDNAVKYAPQTGLLAIRVARTATTASITVADRGPGIPEQSRTQVLKRFFRLEESRTTEGSGLGLSLVHAVAVLHGGRVVLGDNGPGLIATLELPINPAA